jgi:hypothetical protein
MELKPGNGICGEFKKMEEKDEYFVIIFGADKKIKIPKKTILSDELTKFIGERVGLFRYSEDRYSIRKAKKRRRNPKIKRKHRNVYCGGAQYSVFKGQLGTTIIPWDKKKDKQEEMG